MYTMRNCILCGTPFVSNHPRKLFCSAQHAMKAANMRYRNRGKQNIRDTEKVLQHVEPEYIEPAAAEQSQDEGKERFSDVLSFLDEASKKDK